MLNEGNAEADGYPEDEEANDECFEVDSGEVEDHVHSEVGGPIEQEVDEEPNDDEGGHDGEADVQEARGPDEGDAEEEAVDIEEHEHKRKLLEELEGRLHDRPLLSHQVNQSCDGEKAQLHEQHHVEVIGEFSVITQGVNSPV